MLSASEMYINTEFKLWHVNILLLEKNVILLKLKFIHKEIEMQRKSRSSEFFGINSEFLFGLGISCFSTHSYNGRWND
jgi:hypothetical protein